MLCTVSPDGLTPGRRQGQDGGVQVGDGRRLVPGGGRRRGGTLLFCLVHWSWVELIFRVVLSRGCFGITFLSLSSSLFFFSRALYTTQSLLHIHLFLLFDTSTDKHTTHEAQLTQPKTTSTSTSTPNTTMQSMKLKPDAKEFVPRHLKPLAISPFVHIRSAVPSVPCGRRATTAVPTKRTDASTATATSMKTPTSGLSRDPDTRRPSKVIGPQTRAPGTWSTLAEFRSLHIDVNWAVMECAVMDFLGL